VSQASTNDKLCGCDLARTNTWNGICLVYELSMATYFLTYDYYIPRGKFSGH